MKTIMISAGEASGDLHGASLTRAISEQAPGTRVIGMGGKAMQAAGVEIIQDIAEMGVVGLVEILKNLPRFFAIRDHIVAVMERERPDVLVVIDYPEFNMRLAKAAKRLGIPVVFFISPSAWAWRKGRAKDVAKVAAKVAAIFPFEADVYREAGANVEYVGHPLCDIVKASADEEALRARFAVKEQERVVLLLPGSRRQEIAKLLPIMTQAAGIIGQQVAKVRFFLPLASTISREMVEEGLRGSTVNIEVIDGQAYDLMAIGDAAMAASGTVTLEAALLGLPCVVMYRLNPLTYWIGKRLVTIPHFSLPNIVAGREIVPELLQDEVNPGRIAAAVTMMLTEQGTQERLQQELAAVKERLGGTGAVERTATLVLQVAAGTTAAPTE